MLCEGHRQVTTRQSSDMTNAARGFPWVVPHWGLPWKPGNTRVHVHVQIHVGLEAITKHPFCGSLAPALWWTLVLRRWPQLSKAKVAGVPGFLLSFPTAPSYSFAASWCEWMDEIQVHLNSSSKTSYPKTFLFTHTFWRDVGANLSLNWPFFPLK